GRSSVHPWGDARARPRRRVPVSRRPRQHPPSRDGDGIASRAASPDTESPRSRVKGPASVGGRERARLFCALRLPDVVLDELEAWGAEHLAERVVSRENLHITLAFLGHRPFSEVADICRATRDAAAAAAPILLEPKRYRETRSVGMLVLGDEDGAASALAEDLHG